VFHDEVEAVAGARVVHGDRSDVAVFSQCERADVVDRDHVRVRQAGEGLGLAEEQALVIDGAALHELEGDLAAEAGVVGRVHDAEAAASERLTEGVVRQDDRVVGVAEQAVLERALGREAVDQVETAGREVAPERRLVGHAANIHQ
jgi:hypothetical protein